MSADFSLETFRHKLDEQGMSIAENQEQSVKSRKKLAECTRGTWALLAPRYAHGVSELQHVKVHGTSTLPSHRPAEG